MSRIFGLTKLCAAEELKRSLLLTSHREVNKQESDGKTALHYAVMLQNLPCVSILLAARANPVREDMNSESPLSMAFERDNREIIELLRSVETEYSTPMSPMSSVSGEFAAGVETHIAEWELNEQDLRHCETLGSSAYGAISRGLYRGAVVAVKTVPLNKFESALRREIDLLVQLRHPHICLFMGAIIPDASFANDSLRILYEFCEGGSLHSLLHTRQVALSDSQKVRALNDIAVAIYYLHSFDPNILHRHLSTRSILLTLPYTPSERMHLKLADFGLIKAMLSAASGSDTMLPVTSREMPYWLSPEVLRGEPYTESADMYSYGVIGYEVLLGSVPYTTSSQPLTMKILKRVSSGDISLEEDDALAQCDAPPYLSELISKCLSATSRPKALDACNVFRANNS